MMVEGKGGTERERGGRGGKDKQEKSYISQLPINRPMAALLVVVAVVSSS